MSDLSLRTVDITVKGKVFKLTENTLSDFAAFRDYIKTNRLKQVLEVTKGLSIGERSIFLNEATREIVSDAEIQVELQNIEGMLFMIYRSLLKQQPKVTLEEVAAMFNDISDNDLAAIQTIQTSLSKPDKEDEKNSKRVVEEKK